MSEAVMISRNKALDLLEVVKAFKDAILKDRMELVLNTGQNGSPLVLIQPQLLVTLAPVQTLQVQQLVVVDDLAHSCLHLGRIKGARVETNIAWQFLEIL